MQEEVVEQLRVDRIRRAQEEEGWVRYSKAYLREIGETFLWTLLDHAKGYTETMRQVRNDIDLLLPPRNWMRWSWCNRQLDGNGKALVLIYPPWSQEFGERPSRDRAYLSYCTTVLPLKRVVSKFADIRGFMHKFITGEGVLLYGERHQEMLTQPDLLNVRDGPNSLSP